MEEPLTPIRNCGGYGICTVVEEWRRGYFLPRILLFLDILRPRDKDGSEGVAALCSGFCARSLLSCQKLHWSPFAHWSFFFSLVTGTFTSFNPTHSLMIFDHCSCFISPMPGVKVS